MATRLASIQNVSSKLVFSHNLISEKHNLVQDEFILYYKVCFIYDDWTAQNFQRVHFFFNKLKPILSNFYCVSFASML